MSALSIDTARREHSHQISILVRFWLAVLLLQLGLIGLTIGAVPHYETGESPLSMGLALSTIVIVSLLFYLNAQWARAALARVPVEIVDHSGNVRETEHDYVFAEPSDALGRAIAAATSPHLLHLVLLSGISFAAWSLRQGGSSLAFSLLLIALSLFLQWRAYPSLHGIAAKLESIKGVRFSPPFADGASREALRPPASTQ